MDSWNVFYLDDSGEEQMDCVQAQSVEDACNKTIRYGDGIVVKIIKVELVKS